MHIRCFDEVGLNYRFAVSLFMVLFGSISIHVSAQTAIAPEAGDGSEASPYEISSLENLYWLSQTDTVWDKFFLQTANINAADTRTWDVGDHDEDTNTPDTAMGFTPIGYGGFNPKPFSGHYDGGGHIIDSMYINRLNNDYVGFFGNIRESSVTELGLTHVDFTGDSYVGGIAGTDYYLDLSHAFSTGKLKGRRIGFLIGWSSYSTITDCYGIGTIEEGSSYGLIGTGTQTLIKNAYSAVTSTDDSDVPQLIGSVYFTTENSFYDTDLAGDNYVGGTARVTYDLKQSCTYLEAGWDFMDEDINGTTGIWGMNPEVNEGYPFLWWQGKENLADLTNCCFYPELTVEGEGTSENPYQIATECHVKWLSSHDSLLDKHFIQMNDIKIADSYNWHYGNHDENVNTPLIPLGLRPFGRYIRNSNGTLSSRAFQGTYDGQGFVIDSMYINRPENWINGYFGLIKNAHIKNLGLIRANVTGGSTTGIFVGEMQESTVEDCYAEGEVIGGAPTGGAVGGFAGSIGWDSYVYRCYSDCNVYSEHNDVGGFVGSFGGEELSYCYALGTVTGEVNVGGFVGFQSTRITNSYSRTQVISETNRDIGGFTGWGHTDGRATHCYSAAVLDCPDGDYVDGFIGARTEFYLDNCLFDSTLTSFNNTYGSIPYGTNDMKNMCTYLKRHWDFEGEDENGSEDIWRINADFNDGYPFLFWQDAAHTGSCQSVGISVSLTNEAFQVFPNPANNLIQIKLSTDVRSIQVMDVNGKTCMTIYPEGTENTIDVSALSKGIYVIKAVTDTAILTQRLVKQ